MASLFELTDGYPEEIAPIDKALPTDRPRVVINTAEFDKPKPDPLWDKVKSGVSGIGDAIKYASELDQKFTSNILSLPKKAYENSDDLVKGIKNLFGLGEEERYQLWPEKVVREALTSAGDITKPNPYPEGSEQWQFYEDKRQEGMVPAAMAISALAGSGGLAGTGAKAGEVALGATPFLRPALKYKEKLYKGKPGQEHQDIIPNELYQDFQRKAMSGEDLAEYNFGFINDKGHFLDREKALKYGIDTGLIDPHAGRFGALTTTLMADSSKPGVAIESIKNAQSFYSAVEHTVKNIPQGKMTGEQWLGTLSNKPGVKPEEMDWTGLRSFLEENKGKPVTKAQIEEHLAQNKIELKEVSKGDAPAIYDPRTGQPDRVYPEGTPFNPTKYHSYQLPGGENYREILLTLPNQSDEQFIKAYEASTGVNVKQLFGRDPTSTEIANLRRNSAASEVSGEYKSSHWDEPNILAHVRMNDRNIDGKKSLHLEEIQSDWHQQGRDKGYKNRDNKPLTDAEFKEMRELQAKWIKNKLNKEEEIRYGELWNKDQNARQDRGVPDAPFKKSWHELALKRMIREAAEKGYDRLSWTPGEAQAARYDLSKQVEAIRANKNSDGTYQIGYKIPGHNMRRPMSEHMNVTADKLPDVVGKELANKILKNEGGKADEYGRVYEGVDLKIGGEGMKGFYDQIIPKALEKLGKEHGVKVKKGGIGTDNKSGKIVPFKEGEGYYIQYVNGASKVYKTKAEAEAKLAKENAGPEVFYIDIPPSLKDTAMKKGFPLFSSTPGYMFVPFDGDPFASGNNK